MGTTELLFVPEREQGIYSIIREQNSTVREACVKNMANNNMLDNVECRISVLQAFRKLHPNVFVTRTGVTCKSVCERYPPPPPPRVISNLLYCHFWLLHIVTTIYNMPQTGQT